MVGTEEKGRLLAEFSINVQRHFPDVWRSLFEERSGNAKFGSAQRTLVCVECPVSGPLKRDALLASLRRLARRHEGTVDPCADEFAFVSFGNPQDALAMAVELQRLVARARLRVGLASGRCRMARCDAAGQAFLMLLGDERARVRTLTLHAAPGSVQLAPGAYEDLRDAIDSTLGSCIVMESFEDDELHEVSLTLPPDPMADLSTFAGLGLT
ncbi:MAG TPA: hypothetical protein VFM98_05950 [Ramlibacter sp.]|uniref:hypothetical protein n=1 Tax=Ramlibacter sp. TaxID=1917967 RepID=UPI002D7E79E9|nr:hypothetical protein [Ramlibacter sp.]HET8745125.1 hypothetical protein [Ramlibacter sp.]